MTDYSIRVQGLGKCYQLGQHLQYSMLRDSVAGAMATPIRAASRLFARNGGNRRARDRVDRIWALDEVTFDVEQGGVVGVIGRNGAGKSTLLKVLSRITEPTTGRAEIRGTISSLLEVGTGFHPELTGRENVFLNGAIHGMTRAEVDRKFDEIVDFAGVERFVDTPVKRYSSGMLLRLGFGVAAYLEPNVLFVDEVLAVGDAAFQRKCLGRIGQISGEGRTVLFVSHNMAAIRDLCPTAIWLEGGRIAENGPSLSVIDKYLTAVNGAQTHGALVFEDAIHAAFAVRSARLVDSNGVPRTAFEISDPPVVELHCVARERIPGLYGYVALSLTDGSIVFEGDSTDGPMNPLDRLDPGEHVLRIAFPPQTLAPGTYAVHVSFSSSFEEEPGYIHSPNDLGTFTLDDFTTRRGIGRRGFFTTPLDWRLSD